MKAAIYKTYGPPEVLKIDNVKQPYINDEDVNIVLIKVHSSSVNPFDVLHRNGYLPIRLSGGGLLKPRQNVQILGLDVAGTVAAVGKNVNRFKIGDPVFGSCFGSHAEYVRANQNKISLIPKNSTFQEAAAVPTAALTALQALRDLAQIKRGQKVLIYGASGGVGHFAVQFAKFYETEVTAVCSSVNMAWVKELGAEYMIDYAKEDFTKNGKYYDVIYDAVSRLTFFSSRHSLTKTGIYITENPLKPIVHPFQILLGFLMGGKRVKFHLTQPNHQDFDFLRELIEDEKIKPVIDKCYYLDQIREAHRYVENGHARGKVVIQILNG